MIGELMLKTRRTLEPSFAARGFAVGFQEVIPGKQTGESCTV